MEHQTAVKEKAAERYLLGEMSDAERDGFEEHFFGCAECAADVRDGVTVVDNIRAGRRIAAPAPRRFATWTGVAAAAVLVLVLAAQNASLRRELATTLAPHAAAVTFLTSAARGAGEAPSVVVDRKQPQVALDFDIPESPFASYRCELRDSAGRVHASVDVTAAQAKDTIRLLVPTGDLESGNYTLTADGVGPSPARVASYPFIVRVR
jgi:hypothetical protein